MNFFKQQKIERNFPRGIYLSPLGKIPSFEIAEIDGYTGELYIPVPELNGMPSDLRVADGAKVLAGDILALSPEPIYSPCDGVVQSLTYCQVKQYGECRAICIKPSQPFSTHLYLEHGNKSAMPDKTDSKYILELISSSGIVCSDGTLLYEKLCELKNRHIRVIIANAASPEPDVNTPGAILNSYPDKVYTGMALLRHFFEAETSIMAYPNELEIDTEYADIWQVQTVAISEKYPQYHPKCVLQTLRKQGIISRKDTEHSTVFDIQTLALIERVVLAGIKATERIVTVCGDAVENPGHYLVPIGLPLSELLEIAQVDEHYDCIVAGRSLTGSAVDVARTVVSSFCESFVVIKKISEISPDRCFRCGRCIEYCPAGLDPIRLNDLIEVRDYIKAERYGLFDCIECGLCSYCCGSGLRILENIRMAKRGQNG